MPFFTGWKPFGDSVLLASEQVESSAFQVCTVVGGPPPHEAHFTVIRMLTTSESSLPRSSHILMQQA